MKAILRQSSWLMPLLLAALLMKPAAAQTSGQPVETNIEAEYSAGVEAFNANNWPRAIVAFENVLKSKRNFRDTRAKLEKAKRALESESLNAVLAEHYAEGVAAMAKNDLQAALTAWRKVRQINPQYRDIASQLARAEALLQRKDEAATIQVTLTAATALLDSLYKDGLRAAERADWVQAMASFEKLKLLQPNYRDVAGQLARAWEKLDQAKSAEANAAVSNTEKKSSFAGASLAVVFVLSAVGFIALSPVTRARFHLWRGNDKAAAQIYERLLERHPGRAKHYPALADIYRLQDRRDERALKVYKTVLQLNLPFRHRDELNTIVAQKFLIEGRMDSDAIEVLEGALQAERSRQPQIKRTN